MNLDEYLEALKACPDVQLEDGTWRLTSELGINDNWPILLNSGFGRIVRDLGEILGYREAPPGIEGEVRFSYPHVQGTVRVLKKPPMGLVVDGIRPKTKLQRECFERMIRDFNMGMILHTPDSENWTREIANAVVEIGRYAEKEGIPLCFPRTYGLGLSRDQQFSSAVYFYPEE